MYRELLAYVETMLEVVGAIVITARIVVAITPSRADDEALDRALYVINRLAPFGRRPPPGYIEEGAHQNKKETVVLGDSSS